MHGVRRGRAWFIRWRPQARCALISLRGQTLFSCSSVTVALPPFLRPSDLLASRRIFFAILCVTSSWTLRNSCYFSTAPCVLTGFAGLRGGAICRRSLRTAITPVLPCTMTLFTIRFAQALSTGMPWFLIRVSRPTFVGFGFRLWPLSSNPNFASSTTSRLRARATGPALMTIPIFVPRHLASLVTCCVIFCYGCFFCDSGTVCLLYTSPSPRDLSTSRMPSSA